MSCLKIYIYTYVVSILCHQNIKMMPLLFHNLTRKVKKNELEQMILITHKDLEVDLFIVIPCTGEKIKH